MCEDGSAFSGDVLIGCDGVYSKVRQELWRVSHAQDSAAQDLAEQNLMLAECMYRLTEATKDVQGFFRCS
jgi:2-polyprenyl-6-methoxyphenol hydroxylase-like FAD-dependent oxidoreductase